jgi:hypothetical protein
LHTPNSDFLREAQNTDVDFPRRSSIFFPARTRTPLFCRYEKGPCHRHPGARHRQLRLRAKGKSIIGRNINLGTNDSPGTPSSSDSLYNSYSTHTDNPLGRNIHTPNWGLFGSTRNRSVEYDAMINWFDYHRSTNFTQTAQPTQTSQIPSQPNQRPPQTSKNATYNSELAIQTDITKKLTEKMIPPIAITTR